MKAHKPVKLRVKILRSKWVDKTYPTYYVTIPGEFVEALGWEPGDRIIPVLVPQKGVLFSRLSLRPPKFTP